MLRTIIYALGCGAVGGVVNVTFLVVAGAIGLPQILGLELPSFANTGFLYKQVFWGGLWALAFVTPLGRLNWLPRGAIVAVSAACVTFFVFFPMGTTDGQGPGIAGLNIGMLMPVYVLLADLSFGLAASRMYNLNQTARSGG